MEPPDCYRCEKQPCVCRDGQTLYQGDALDVLGQLPQSSVDLVFGSPPYEDARTYGLDFRLTGQDWVDWMVQRVLASLRVCRGLVAFVVEGKTRQFRWSATPVLLMADLHRAGVHLRKPLVFHRVGIPGSGGPDWLRGDTEWIVCATNGGKLPWSENTAMGHPPKWAPGGAMSHRITDGTRVNQWGCTHQVGGTDKHGKKHNQGNRPSHIITTKRSHTKRRADGDMEEQGYAPPQKANPGNVIQCKVGGGLMGHPLAHENEAPFPESLVEFFVRSFCPPRGTVCDPFSGSGTTLAVAKKEGRRGIGIDIRQSQCDLANRRITEEQMELFTPTDSLSVD